MKSVIKSIAILFFALTLSAAGIAQSTSIDGMAAARRTGSLRGLVGDPQGKAIRDARVVALYAGKLAAQETRTNEQGEFYFDRLRPGDYTIAIEATGMTQSGGAQPAKIEAGREYRIVIPLTVAAIEDAVIVSATRTDSAASETAASVFIASGSDLLRAQRTNVFDALRASPGVAVLQTARRGGQTSLFVRGGESDYTKILIDGVPVNEAGGAFDLADLTTDNTARVELVRGAQSAIYGSDAMSGVLQIFTHRGTTRIPEFELTGEGGSFAFQRQFARLSGATGGFDYSTSFTHLRTDGRDRNDDYQNRIATAHLGYRFNSRTQLRATLRNDTSGLGVPGATARLFPDPDERAERKHVATSVRLDDQTTRYWHQSFSFVFAESNYSSFDPAAQDLSKPNTPLDTAFAFNDFASLFNNHQHRRGFRYQSDFVLPNAHFISAGIDFEQERAVFDSGFAGRNRVPSDRRNVGAFIQDQFAYGPKLFVTAGIRVENNRADLPASFARVLADLKSAPFTGTVGYGTEVMPKLSAVYVLRLSGIRSRRGPTRLKANWGRGIKSPSLVEAFSPSPFFLGNPALRPERALNFDIGVEQFFWKDRIRVEGTYFENRFRDQVAFVGNPATFGGPIKLPDGRLTHYVSYDRTHARGYELSVAWHPRRSLQLGGSYTFLVSELETAADVIDFNTLKLVPNREVGLPLLRRPRHSGAINFAWTGDKLGVNMDAFLVGKRRDVDPVFFTRFDAAGKPIYNDGYAKLDLAGSYRINSYVSLFARIENLLNQDYEEVLGYPAYRLNFSAGMKFRIGGGK
ncbi:MAG: TonB-dependent receptor [Blastocatellia bacterium]